MCDLGRIFTAKKEYIQEDWNNTDIHDTHMKSTDKDYFFPEDFNNINLNRHDINKDTINNQTLFILSKISESNILIPNYISLNFLINNLIQDLKDHKYLEKYPIYMSNSLNKKDKKEINKENNNKEINNYLLFNIEDYNKIYPHLKANKILPENLYYANFMKYCKIEKHIPNLFMYYLIKYNNIYEMQNKLTELSFYKNKINNEIDNKIDNIIINIITRTHNRQYKFNELVNYIDKILIIPDNITINHYVSYDNAETKLYVYDIIKNIQNEKYRIIPIDLIKYSKVKHPNEYFDYIYDHIDDTNYIEWILIIDDDDIFTTPYFLYYLNDRDNKDKINYLLLDKIIIWTFFRNDKFIYPKDINNPQVGEIATCSYLFRKELYKKGYGKWVNNAIGDFNFIINIFEKDKVIYIDVPFTGINYKDEISISGWSAM